MYIFKNQCGWYFFPCFSVFQGIQYMKKLTCLQYLIRNLIFFFFVQTPQACSSLITSNTMHSGKSKDSYGDKQYEINCLAYQPDLRPQSPSYWYQQLREQEVKSITKQGKSFQIIFFSSLYPHSTSWQIDISQKLHLHPLMVPR